MNENPPPRDQVTALLPMFRPLGLELGKTWDRTKVHPLVLAAMKQAAADVGMKTLVDIPPGKFATGGMDVALTGNFRTDYLVRAQIVRWGLSANTLEEAVYIGALLDSDNKPLMGDKKYTVTLKPPAFKEPRPAGGVGRPHTRRRREQGQRGRHREGVRKIRSAI